MKKPLTLSIVIPVYNEEYHLKACLEAIAKQTVKPKEVIVVDNNSTDRTAAISKGFKFVRLLKEPKQGTVFARDRGFNAAKGDIIGRINADSLLASDWIARVLENFSNRSIAAITGLGITYTFPRIHWPHTTLWSRDYYWSMHLVFNTFILWGANMAVSRDAWLKVREHVCRDEGQVHEDTDLSLVLVSHGFCLFQDNHLLIKTNGQNYHYWPKLIEYSRRTLTTKRRHNQLGFFNKHHIQRYGLWRALPGGLLSSVLNIPFFAVSFLLWPVDMLMAHSKVAHRWWLD